MLGLIMSLSMRVLHCVIQRESKAKEEAKQMSGGLDETQADAGAVVEIDDDMRVV